MVGQVFLFRTIQPSAVMSEFKKSLERGLQAANHLRRAGMGVISYRAAKFGRAVNQSVPLVCS